VAAEVNAAHYAIPFNELTEMWFPKARLSTKVTLY